MSLLAAAAVAALVTCWVWFLLSRLSRLFMAFLISTATTIYRKEPTDAR